MTDHIHISAARILDAPSSVVYNVIADYHTGHPLIVPKPYFQKIEVVSGGIGAGTTLLVTMRVLGTTSLLRHLVSEPEPGTVLVETDLDTGDQTTFTVSPMTGSTQTQVNISTIMTTRPGIRGQIERRLIPLIMRPAYRKELRFLEAIAQRKMGSPGA
jgi:hypothetical protein